MAEAKSPWEHRRWRGGMCRPDVGGKAVMFWFLALMFGGIAAGIALKSPDMFHFSQVRWAVLFPAGFAATGLAFGVAALVSSARWFRFGRCLVRLSSVPGVIGGHFRGEVLLPETFPLKTDVRMELVCERTTIRPGATSESLDNVSVGREWAHTLRVTADGSRFRRGHCLIPFDFTIPYGLADETNSHREGDARIEVRWRLRVFARLDGPDLDVTYRVPVFRTGESDPSVTGEKGGEKSLDAFLRDTGERRRVRIENLQGVPTYICDARGMKAGLAVVPGITGLVMLAGAAMVACNALPELVKDVLKKGEGWSNLFRLFPLVMALGMCLLIGVFGLLGLLFLFIGVQGLLSRRTWIRSGRVYRRTSLFGIPWTLSVPCASVTGVNIGDSTTSGGKTWYNVVIERKIVWRFVRTSWLYLFTRLTVATNVPTREEADEIMKRLRQDLRLAADADGLEDEPESA